MYFKSWIRIVMLKLFIKHYIMNKLVLKPQGSKSEQYFETIKESNTLLLKSR